MSGSIEDSPPSAVRSRFRSLTTDPRGCGQGGKGGPSTEHLSHRTRARACADSSVDERELQCC
eukprot:9978825-Alexandrium_andersonii.AAC.1